MMFSIIIPVYKVEAYLPACIESILAQTYKDWELILVDDGSPDNSGKICDLYAERQRAYSSKQSANLIRVFHKKNGGPSSARNLGIEQARGEYITFVDSDDWVTSDYLEKLSSACLDVDMLFFPIVWHYADGCKVIFSSEEKHVLGKDAVESEIYRLIKNDAHHLYFGYTVNKVFRKSIIDTHNIRFREGLSISEDEVFTHDYAQHINSVRFIDAPLYQYRIQSESLTNRMKAPEEFIRISDCLLEVGCYYTKPELLRSLHMRAIDLRWEAIEGEHKFFKEFSLLRQIRHLCNQYDLTFSMRTFFRILIYKILRR